METVKLVKAFNLYPKYDYYLDIDTNDLYKDTKKGLRKLSNRKTKKGHRYYRLVLDGEQYEVSLVKLIALFKFGMKDSLLFRNSLKVTYSPIGFNEDDLWIYSKENDVKKVKYEDVKIGDVYRALYYKYIDSLELFYTDAISLLDYNLKAYKTAVRSGYKVYKKCELGNCGFWHTIMNPELLINDEGGIINLETCRILKPVLKRSMKKYRNKDTVICGLNLRLNVLVYQTFYEDVLGYGEQVLCHKDTFNGSQLYKRKLTSLNATIDR